MKNQHKYFSILVSSVIMMGLMVLNVDKVQGVTSTLMQVFVVNLPDIFKIREQNVDTQGNIKVSVKNVTPIPVAIDNTSGLSASKVIAVWNNYEPFSGEILDSKYIDVNGYRKVVVYASKPIENSTIIFSMTFSVDGVNDYSSSSAATLVLDTVNNNVYKELDVLGPKIKILAPNVNPNSPSKITVNIYLIK